MNRRPAGYYCPKSGKLTAQLPPPELALDEPAGLLAVGGRLDTETLIHAYRNGIFPWYSEGQPPLWWSPDPRTVIQPARLHVSRSLWRNLRRTPWRITLDAAFGDVIRACAAPRAREAGTWISAEMIAAYEALHREGYAHSLECWIGDRLVGGIYGVVSGAVFCGESMFSRVSDGSKVALYALCARLQHWGYVMLDCQVENPHLRTMGAEALPRQRFLARLRDEGLAAGVIADAWHEDPLGGCVA